MSDATGLHANAVAVLEAIDRIGGGRTSVRCDLVTEVAGPDAYATLLGLARPWVVHLATVAIEGNLGSPDFDAADPEYTACRLTPLGIAALEAERGGGSPLPIGVVNGDLHLGGSRPPFDPARMVDVIERAEELDDDALVALMGPPSFPTGCDVVVDGDLLVATARMAVEGNDQLIVSHLPPGCSVGAIACGIQQHNADSLPRERPPVVDVIEMWTGGAARLVVRARTGHIAEVAQFVRSLRCVSRRWSVDAPTAAMVRRFAGRDAAETREHLRPIRAAIRPRDL